MSKKKSPNTIHTKAHDSQVKSIPNSQSHDTLNNQVQEMSNVITYPEAKDVSKYTGFCYLGQKTYACGNQTHTMQEYRHKQTGMEFVYIPGGIFFMGSNNGNSNEEPVHAVRLTPYLIAKTQTTQDVWQKIMWYNPSCFQSSGSNAPVENISWNHCQEFCRRTGLSLPTEAQWEYAARGGSRGKWAYGDDESQLMQYAWYGYYFKTGNSGYTTHPVAMLAPNAYGLYDMSGNVWEWCQDWYADYPRFSLESPLVNPTGSHSGSSHIIRGGSWSHDADDCRITYRFYAVPEDRSYDLGVRFVQCLY